MTITTVQSPPNPALAPQAERDWPAAVWRGAKGRCPACGKGKLFAKYLKVADTCHHCSEDLSHQRADDAPAYFTIFIVGHVVAGGALSLEQTMAPPTWVHAALWLPLTLLLCLWLLPRIKGALVGLQWALRMHGFAGKGPDEPDADPADAVRDAGHRPS